MAQAGFTPIQLYRTTTASAQPSAGNLAAGELAINLTDKKLYAKDASNNVFLLADASSGGTTAANLAGGAAGSLPYQSGANATTFLGIGAANRVLTSSGTAPQWVTSLTGLTGVSSSSMTNTSLTSGRLVYSTTGGAQTDSANLTFDGTSLTLGGNPTLSAGTANGVLYLNGSKVATSGSALTFDGTTITQTASTPVFGLWESASGNSNRLLITQSAGLATYNLTYSTLGTVAQVWQLGGSEQMRLTSTGLGIGTSSPLVKFDVKGATDTHVGITATGIDEALILAYDDGGIRTPNLNYAAASHKFLIGLSGTEAMRLDSSGNLGIGTASPAFKLDVEGSQRIRKTGAGYNADMLSFSTISETAAVYRMGMATGGVFTIGRSDVPRTDLTLDTNGNLSVGTAGESPSATSFDRLQINAPTSSGRCAIRMGLNDARGGAIIKDQGTFDLELVTQLNSSTNTGNLIFKNNPVTENARFTSSGALLLGTTDGNLSSGVGYKFAVGGSWGVVINQASTYNSFHYYNENAINNGYRFYVQADGGVANYSGNNVNLSDARVKTDIKPAPSYWNLIKAIEIVTFKYKDQDHSGDTIGVIAQQVERVAPELVDNRGFGETPEDGTPLKAVFSNDMYHAAIKALQEAMRRIEALEAKVAALEVK